MGNLAEIALDALGGDNVMNSELSAERRDL